MTDTPFDVVAFDLDGTLADTAPDIAAALNRTLDQLGRSTVEPERVRSMIGGGARNLLRRALALSGVVDDALLDRAYPVYLDCYAADICSGTRIYPGVETALDALARRGTRLAICTNKPGRLTSALVEALGWTDRFPITVSGDSLPRRKPDPLPLETAIAQAGGGKAAFVGDSLIDAQTARAAAIPFVAVSFGYPEVPPEDLQADALIDHYDALAGALERVALTHRCRASIKGGIRSQCERI